MCLDSASSVIVLPTLQRKLLSIGISLFRSFLRYICQKLIFLQDKYVYIIFHILILDCRTIFWAFRICEDTCVRSSLAGEQYPRATHCHWHLNPKYQTFLQLASVTHLISNNLHIFTDSCLHLLYFLDTIE